MCHPRLNGPDVWPDSGGCLPLLYIEEENNLSPVSGSKTVVNNTFNSAHIQLLHTENLRGNTRNDM